MKRILIFLLFLFQLASAQTTPINRLVFFGDSLSDNGYLYSLTLHFIPKSPPYFQGRFSDGHVWSEDLVKYFPKGRTLDYKIYALGGATAIFHLPTTKYFAPTTLELEVDRYLLDELFYNKEDILFSIWIGGNDYLFDPNVKADELTTKVANKIGAMIGKLHYYGGKHFLILNMPDLGKIPRARAEGTQLPLHALTLLHNQKLEEVIQSVQKEFPDADITMVRIDQVFEDVMSDPKKFNEKYHINIVNTTDACWSGGLWRRFLQMAVTDSPSKALKDFIMASPALLETYQLGKAYEQGAVVPCTHPETYLFWDSIHPSAIVHDVLAQVVAERLNK